MFIKKCIKMRTVYLWRIHDLLSLKSNLSHNTCILFLCCYFGGKCSLFWSKQKTSVYFQIYLQKGKILLFGLLNILFSIAPVRRQWTISYCFMFWRVSLFRVYLTGPQDLKATSFFERKIKNNLLVFEIENGLGNQEWLKRVVC